MSKAQKISIYTEVENFKVAQNRDQLSKAIENFEGKKICITLERVFKKRSNKQNAYYWAVIIEHWKHIIREEWGEIWTPEETHEFLKSNLNYTEYVDEETGEIILNPVTGSPIRKPKSTTENTTMSQEDYHKSCRDLAWLNFSYQIPLPNEDIKAEY